MRTLNRGMRSSSVADIKDSALWGTTALPEGLQPLGGGERQRVGKG